MQCTQLILSEDPTCTDEHIPSCMKSYLSNFTDHPAELNDYKQLTDLTILWNNLHTICSHSDAVQQYYHCVFTELSACFRKDNDSRQDELPDASRISQAFKDLCDSHTDINQTCFDNTITGAQSCYVTTRKDTQESVDCKSFELLLKCFEEQRDCEGYQVIEGFFMSTDPAVCAGNVQQLTLSLLLLAFVAFFLKND
ncbi:uncharacterized protein LOC112563706 isoform X2 [Pomacea canaliculata]|uniref:uncharacterized protein LOC112563706 isoform X2 n=1 Tax=Pomacea canaliculata TaxID=400727 RepID=UPI000D73D488|nr:uncharacterized protein LOC112563706 isoform X2 [Pomacea canaliculata]